MPQENRYQEADNLSQLSLDELERRIADEFSRAQQDMQRTADEYFRDFRRRDDEMRQQVTAGKITEQQYKSWRLTQLARGERFNAMRDKMAARATNASIIAAAYINDTTPGIYSLNRNFAGYVIEKYSGDIDFTLWDEQTVRRLIMEHPDLMPYYPEERAIARGIDQAWGRRVITNNVTQSILLGESIPKMTQRIASTITNMSHASAVRAARTAVTGAENGGRLAGMEAAQRKGIDVQKEWLSTLDGRTRHEHREMDGQVVPLNEKFPNGLMYPGDPKGRPESVYNCRCTMVSNIAGIDTTKAQRRARNAETGQNEVISNMTYSQWAGWKQEQQQAPVYRPTVAELAARGAVSGAVLRKAMKHCISGYTPDGQEMLMEQLEQAPQEVQEMFAAYGPDLQRNFEINPWTLSKEPSGVAYYAPGRNCVVLHPDEVISGDTCHTPGQVHFHEYGHNIDNLMGVRASGDRQMNYSSYWRNADGKTFEDIINDDVLADIAKIYGENNYGSMAWGGDIPYAKEVKKVLNEYRKQNGSTKEYKELLKEYNKTKKDLDWYGETSVDALLSWENFMETHRDQLLVADAAAHGENAVEVWIRKVRREGDEYANGDLSDMAAKTTIKLADMPYPLDVGHDAEYYETAGALGTEGFAELTSAFTSNPESLEQIKKHLPNVYDSYLQMIKEGTELLNEH